MSWNSSMLKLERVNNNTFTVGELELKIGNCITFNDSNIIIEEKIGFHNSNITNETGLMGFGKKDVNYMNSKVKVSCQITGFDTSNPNQHKINYETLDNNPTNGVILQNDFYTIEKLNNCQIGGRNKKSKTSRKIRKNKKSKKVKSRKMRK